MELILSRKGETKNSTYGELSHDGKHLCWIIEDGKREKKVAGETRIPAGRYKIERQTSGRFFRGYNADFDHTWVPHLLDVPGFEGILIHIGNDTSDTRGCLLPNRFIGHTGLQYFGKDSRIAYLDLYLYLDPIKEDIFITITDPK